MIGPVASVIVNGIVLAPDRIYKQLMGLDHVSSSARLLTFELLKLFLLTFELLKLSRLTLDFGFLCRHAPLQVFIVSLPRLHLVADERTTDESYRRADARSGTGVAGRAADDGSQTSAAEGPNRCTFFPSRHRLGAAE
jgi:hypothetical protein